MTADSASAPPQALRLLGRAVRHEMFGVFVAGLLSAIAFYVLREGYINWDHSLPVSWPFEPVIIPLLSTGLAAIYLVRKIRILPWFWICCLIALVLDSEDKMDGHHRCVWCDSEVEVLVLVTGFWVVVAAASWLTAFRLQAHQASYLTRLARPDILAVLAAVALYGISYYSLRWGYNNAKPNSEFGPWPVDPTIIPFSLAGLVGVYLTRKRRMLPWVWISLLVIWTFWNFADYWIGHFFVNGQRGCVLCDNAVLTLWLITIPWIFVSFAMWLTLRPADDGSGI